MLIYSDCSDRGFMALWRIFHITAPYALTFVTNGFSISSRLAHLLPEMSSSHMPSPTGISIMENAA